MNYTPLDSLEEAAKESTRSLMNLAVDVRRELKANYFLSGAAGVSAINVFKDHYYRGVKQQHNGERFVNEIHSDFSYLTGVTVRPSLAQNICDDVIQLGTLAGFAIALASCSVDHHVYDKSVSESLLPAGFIAAGTFVGGGLLKFLEWRIVESYHTNKHTWEYGLHQAKRLQDVERKIRNA